jgi:hypothetical protein
VSARARRALLLAALPLALGCPLAARRARADDAESLPEATLDLGGGDRVQGMLAAQLRVTGAWDELGHGEGSGLGLQRVRPGLRATLLDERVRLALTLNTSPIALELIELWAEVAVEPTFARLRAGQWKVPFTLYRQPTFSELSFVDWARAVTEPFGAEHAIGLAVSGALPAHGLRYDLGVFTGTPTRAAHGTGVAKVYGERVTNLSELGSFAPPERVHPELVGRLVRTFGDPDRDGVDVALSAAWDTDPTPRQDLSLRLAPELRARAGPVRAHLGFYAGLAPIAGDPMAPALFGMLAEVSVRPARSVELALRFARTARTAALLADARGYAAEVLQAAQESERGALAARHATTGRVRAEQELVLGATWLVIGRDLTVQADVGWLSAELDDDVRDDFRVRLQAQFVL